MSVWNPVGFPRRMADHNDPILVKQVFNISYVCTFCIEWVIIFCPFERTILERLIYFRKINDYKCYNVQQLTSV